MGRTVASFITTYVLPTLAVLIFATVQIVSETYGLSFIVYRNSTSELRRHRHLSRLLELVVDLLLLNLWVWLWIRLIWIRCCLVTTCTLWFWHEKPHHRRQGQNLIHIGIKRQLAQRPHRQSTSCKVCKLKMNLPVCRCNLWHADPTEAIWSVTLKLLKQKVHYTLMKLKAHDTCNLIGHTAPLQRIEHFKIRSNITFQSVNLIRLLDMTWRTCLPDFQCRVLLDIVNLCSTSCTTSPLNVTKPTIVQTLSNVVNQLVTGIHDTLDLQRI